MKRKLLTTILLAGALHFFVFAQNLSDSKFNEINKQAEEFFVNAQYHNAIKYYEKINKSNHNSPEIEYRLGLCYLLSASHNELAREHFEKAYTQGYNTTEEDPILDYDFYHNDYISEDINYCLGRAYQLHLEFDKAVEHYNIFKGKYEKAYNGKGKQQNQELKVLDHIIETAYNGKKLVAKPVKGVTITNLGNYVNSEEEEIAPLITADEQTLYFTSRRRGSTGGKIDVDERYMEDVYISTKDVDGNWKKAQRVSTRINTSEHDAAVAISPDGSKLILYKNNHHGTGELYASILKGYTWSTPEKMGGGINTKYLENSATISADKKTIYFVSNRPHGIGKQDIYVAHKKDDGTWGEAKNLGTEINTPYDEDAPFIHADGKHLYFCSKGHNSMGGYDIFRTTYNEETESWEKPENLGYPINTPDNDVFFVWSPDGKRAYFSSHHEDSYGDQDIYMMTLPHDEKAVIVLKGIIREKKNQRAIYAEIHIRNNDTKEEVAVFHSNSFSGKYTVVLPADGHYAINIIAEGFIPTSDRFDLPKKDGYYEKELDFELEKKEDGSIVELKNVFFENNKADLNESAYSELDKFVELLNEHSEIQAEIAGHTESGGLEDNNEDLSLRRGQAVANYITSKGISKRRVKAVGYGSKHPINKGLTEEEKRSNRRTEIIIHHTDMEGKHWKPYYHK